MAITTFLHDIHSGWNSSKATEALFVDISGTYDTGIHEKLLHKLMSINVPSYLTLWISSFLQNHFTSLTWDNYTSPLFLVLSGVPQGSPLSPLLYIMYLQLKTLQSSTIIICQVNYLCQ
jgi:hypothetical protein